MKDQIDRAAKAVVESYSAGDGKIHHLDRQPLPSHAEIIRVLVTIHELLFPGYIGARGLSGESLRVHVEGRMAWLFEAMTEQIKRAICHGHEINTDEAAIDRTPMDCAADFLAALPRLR